MRNLDAGQLPTRLPRPKIRRKTLSCAVITALDDLTALKDEWSALYDAAASPSPPQSYFFVRAAWEVFGAASGMEFAVLTCRNEEQLVGVWAISRETSSPSNWLHSPGFGGGEEYAGPLVVEADGNEAVILELLSQIRRFGPTVKVTVPAEHPICRIRLSFISRFALEIRSPIVSFGNFRSFDEWLNTKSSSFRKGLRYDRRKLGDGKHIEVLDGSQQFERSSSIIDWQFEEKRRWLQRKDRAASWVMDDRCPLLLKKISAIPALTGVEIWALLVDNIPAAAAVCFVSRISIELFMIVMDPDFGARSPGNLLLEDIARSAYARGRNFDFRITTDHYKMRWADTISPHYTFVIALSLRGYPAVFKARYRSWVVATRRFGKRNLLALKARIEARRRPGRG